MQNRPARLPPATAIPVYCSFTVIPQHCYLSKFPLSDQYMIHKLFNSMVFHHNYRIHFFNNRCNRRLTLLTIARFHLLLSVTCFLPKPWFIAPAKLVSTGMTCMAFLLLGPTLCSCARRRCLRFWYMQHLLNLWLLAPVLSVTFCRAMSYFLHWFAAWIMGLFLQAWLIQQRKRGKF